MLIIMNTLIAVVFFAGLSLTKAAWSEGKILKSIGIMILDIAVCTVLLVAKESMKAENRLGM